MSPAQERFEPDQLPTWKQYLGLIVHLQLPERKRFP